MFIGPEKLSSIQHPLVNSMRLKKEAGAHSEDVLVIETCFPCEDDDYTMFDTYLMDLLLDLEDLKNKAESCVGSFNRVDIQTRSHH